MHILSILSILLTFQRRTWLVRRDWIIFMTLKSGRIFILIEFKIIFRIE